MARFHLAEDTIDAKDISALIEWLKTGPRLTKDRLTVEFEGKWNQWLSRRFSVFVNSGSSANLLMYYALLLSGKLKNKKVVVPSAAWVTSIAPAIQFGFDPLMCEADEHTFGLDLVHLEKLLKKHRPSAVLLVQVLGVPHKMNRILELKKKYGFFLLEDTCASVGSTYFGRKTGTFGDMSSFSFYFGHQMSTIEGGMISTDDRQFANLLLMLRSHGWGKDLDAESHAALLKKHKSDNAHNPFVFYEPGFNVRSTDLNAFLGLRQMNKLDWMVRRRDENHKHYQKKLGERFLIQRPEDPSAVLASIHFAIVTKSTAERRNIADALVAHGIETRLYTAGNLGRHPFWAKRFGKTSFSFADKLYARGLFLPNHPAHAEKDIEFISQVVLDSVCVEKS